MSQRRNWVRPVLGAAATGLLAAIGSGGGCAAPFDPPGLVNSLRVLSVDIDRPYANPGETVTLTMNFFDGRDTGGEFTPVSIVWLGGCFNPPGNQYYGCYEPLGALFESLSTGSPPPDGLIGFGPVFELALPDDLVSSADQPASGTRYGTAYVFFLACAGEVRPVAQEGDTEAGAFPIGCFDSDGRQLGAEAFVPGYTQVYAFEDARENPNPPVAGLLWDEELLEPDAIPTVQRCLVSDEDRKQMGCAATDEFTECTTVTLDIDVDENVADVDEESVDAEGNPLKEVVWVSYFATAGAFESEIKLVNDAKEGLQTERTTKWVPPVEAGLYEIWSVTRDNRGGSTTIRHTVEVTE